MGFREREDRMSLRRALVTSVSGLTIQDSFLGRKQSTLVVIIVPGLEWGAE